MEKVDFQKISIAQTCDSVRTRENIPRCPHCRRNWFLGKIYSPKGDVVYFEDREGNSLVLCEECSEKLSHWEFWWESKE